MRIKFFFKLAMLGVALLFVSFWFLVSFERRTIIKKATTPIVDSTYFEGNDYAVITLGCRILDLAPFDYNYLRYFNPEPNPDMINCDKSGRGELVKSTTTHLYVDMSVASNYTRRPFVCCFKPFRRVTEKRKLSLLVNTSYIHYIDYLSEYMSSCFRFVKPTVVPFQFVMVKCREQHNKSSLFYVDYFTFAVENSKLRESGSSRKRDYTNEHEAGEKIDQSNDKQYSVLILGFDGMSRLNFLRQMPRTASFFEENDGVSLIGYNKVGYNTFPNLMPILTGMNQSEIVRECWPTNRSVLDDCPFIWKSFKKKNYYTAYGEDNTFVSTFSYQKLGFREQPVDYYLKPFFVESEVNLVVTKLEDLTSILCVGNKPNIVRFEQAVRGFASNMKNRPTFGLFWFNGVSHDYLNLPRLGDKLFRSMLDKLKAEGVFNSTILIALSDHGIRWGPFRKTFQGFLEERLPLATILLPEGFKNEVPTAVENLKINARRLTSPFDFHETLLDILYLDDLTRNKKREYEWKKYNSYGRSLFYPIPVTRTCPEAGIPVEWCACSVLRELPLDLRFSRILAEEAVRSINRKLRIVPQCSRLRLSKVNAVWDDAPWTVDPHADYIFRDFIVTFETHPGGGSFESRMRRTSQKNVINVGIISRLNMYHNDSYCVEDEILKLYCYCAKKRTTEESSNEFKVHTLKNITRMDSQEYGPVPLTYDWPESEKSKIIETTSSTKNYMQNEAVKSTFTSSSNDNKYNSFNQTKSTMMQTVPIQ